MAYHEGNMFMSALDALPRDAEVETVDQRIAYAQALATLAVAQELSQLNEAESPFSNGLLRMLQASIPTGIAKPPAPPVP